MFTLTIPAADDFHLHLRDDGALSRTVKDAAKHYARALIMPNLVPAVDSPAAAAAYRARILNAVPPGKDFTPLLSLYLSENLTPETVIAGKQAGISAVKWYPKGATTNSAQGVGEVQALYPILEAMQQTQMLLLIHGEVTDAGVDIFIRETVFIDTVLRPLRRKFPKLRMVLEHITTKDAVHYVQSQAENLAATITAHHLLCNRNALLVGGIKPHYYCLPVLKSEDDRKALLGAVASGDRRFFLGSDSAPHEKSRKEGACGCAGCYTAYAGLSLYAAAFEQINALDRLGNFAARYGADYYGLPYNRGEITLQKSPQTFPRTLPYADGEVVPFLAGEQWAWRKL